MTFPGLPVPRPDRSRVRRIAVGGFVAVALYAAFAAVHTLVLNPLAAVPGRSLGQIYDDVAAAGESMGVPMTLVFLGLGVLAAFVLLRALWRSPKATPVTAVQGYLTLLVAGGPAFFWAGFAPGMSLADAYGIGGGQHHASGTVLYAVSAVAGLALVVVVLRARRSTATARR